MDSYEEIVRNWYNKIKPLFQNSLRKSFGNLLSADDIEDLYQETFIAVYENLQKGTVKYNTAWRPYLIQIGENLATKKIGKSLKSESLDGMCGYDEEKQEMQVRRVERLLQEYMKEDDSLCNNVEVVHVLGNTLQFTPEPCSTIIRLFYYDDMSMEEISTAVNMKNADTAKSKKSQCMKGFVTRVKTTLKRLGII